jgi:hypothetical protein
MRIPIAVQLALLVMLTSLLGLTVISIATVSMPRWIRTTKNSARILIAGNLVGEQLQIRDWSQVRQL